MGEGETTGRAGRAAWIGAGAIALILAPTLAWLKVGQLRGFRTNDYDTGIYANLVWNIAHGEGFWSDVLGVNHLGEHVSPICAVFAPLTWWLDAAVVVLAAQGLAVGVGVALFLPLLVGIGRPLGRRRWLVGIGLTAAAALYKPLLSALWFQFHPSTLGLPLLVGALIALRARRAWTLGVLVALLLTTKEVAVASVLGLALYAWLVLGWRRAAVVLAAVAAGAAVVAFGLVLPAMRGATWGHVGRFAPMLALEAKGEYVLLLLAGLGFLPLLGWRALIAAAPLIAVNLSVGFGLQFSRSAHYDDQGLVFLVVAAGHGAVVLGHWLDRVAERSRVLGWSLAVPLMALVGAGVWQWRGELPHNEVARWRTGPAYDELWSRVRAVGAAPADQGVVAQAGLGPYVNQRKRYEMIRTRPDRMPYRPGDLVLMTDLVGAMGVNLEAHRRFLRASPHAEVVSEDQVLQVYRWTGPAADVPDRRPRLKTGWRDD